jgi:hypothetical protein
MNRFIINRFHYRKWPNPYSVVSAIEENRIDAAPLNVRIKDGALSIIESKADDIANEFFGLDARERRIEIIGVADVDRVDARHSRVDDESIGFFAIAAVSADVTVSTRTDGLVSVK